MITGWFAFTRRVLDALSTAWSHHHCSSHGAAVAFYTLFSLAPIVVLVLAVAAWFVDERVAAGELVEQIRGLTGARGAEVVQQVIEAARFPTSGAWPTILAAVSVLVGATTAFAEVKAGLDEIWGVKRSPGRRGARGFFQLIRGRLLSFSLVLVLAFLLLVSLMVSAVIQTIQRYWTASLSAGSMLLMVASAISFAIVTVLFAVILKLLPEAHIRWRDAWVGALVTAALFTLGKHLIGIYLGHAQLTSSFGAAGSLGVLLLWVYFAAQIFFLGAEITRLQARGFPSASSVSTETGCADAASSAMANGETPAPGVRAMARQ